MRFKLTNNEAGSGLDLCNRFEPSEQFYPFFINEAAYYESGVAFNIAIHKIASVTVVAKAGYYSSLGDDSAPAASGGAASLGDRQPKL